MAKYDFMFMIKYIAIAIVILICMGVTGALLANTYVSSIEMVMLEVKR